MVNAQELVSKLLETEDVDWTPDLTDPDDSTSTDMPVGYVVLMRKSGRGEPLFYSKHAEWDGSYATTLLDRARIFKRAATIERNWPAASRRGFRPVPVYSRHTDKGYDPLCIKDDL